MTDTMITYHSVNSRPDQQWLGFICPNERRLGITFFGKTEEEVKQKMREFWAMDREVREKNRAKRAARSSSANQADGAKESEAV